MRASAWPGTWTESASPGSRTSSSARNRYRRPSSSWNRPSDRFAAPDAEAGMGDVNAADGTVEHVVSGLEQPAEIVVDRWGIPHIRAATRHDVFFVQGFNAARDRLWQLDLWRKRGLGLMAADFGPGFLAQDRAARLFLYRGDMDAEWAAYGTSEARRITEAFVAGINAFVALTARQPDLLPPEFAVTG